MTLFELTSGFLMFSSAIFGQGAGQAQTTASVVDNQDMTAAKFINYTNREQVSRYVKEYFADTPVLAEIARCESTYRQVGSNGEVIRGNVNRYDVGIMQINELYHGKKASELGYDLHTLDGNLSYAKYLYEKEGVKPWFSSSKCWHNADAKLSVNSSET